MKKIYLFEKKKTKWDTTDNFVMVDDEDYEELNKHKWHLMKIYHTENVIFYARRYEGLTRLGTYKAILMHRFILKLTDRKQKGDHIDGNGLNNQRHNLREATHGENLKNLHRNKNPKTSSYKGVMYLHGKWGVRINKGNKIYQKYGFSTEVEAAHFYNKIAVELHGDKAVLNVYPCN